jgi:hypothetical protein
MSTNAKKTLKDFGYGFNSNGKLRQLHDDGGITDEPFKFAISSSHAENQANYEALGEVINEYVYDLLEENGMHKILLGTSDIPDEQKSFVFTSSKELIDVDKLMVIIHGSGVVRAGQWARSLIINDSINSGTILPYIKKARENGFEIVVTNTNDNYRNGKKIAGSSSPEAHAQTVWETLIQPANAKSIAIVAHSYGGVVTVQLASKYKEDFEKQVFAVAFTDSVHGRGVSRKVAEVGINFVTSEKPVNTVLRSAEGEMELRSAGHIKHEMTSYACIDSLFEFINQRYEESALPAKKKQKTEEEL